MVSLIVLKLGGSLLNSPDLQQRVRRLLALRPSCRILIVVGGGTAADVVREWSHQHALPEESAHWIAIRSLSMTRALVKELLPEVGEVGSHDEALRCWAENPAPLLLNIEAYLTQAEPVDPAPLPHTWDVTSDSIAAWVASRWSADELVLVKSINLKSDLTLDQAQRDKLVDDHFPHVATKVSRILWCNLHDSEIRIQPWLEDGDCSR